MEKIKSGCRTLIVLFIFTSVLSGFSCAQVTQINAVSIYSGKMDINVKNIVILPADYNSRTSKKYPVVYLLHGHGGNQNSFLNIKPNLPELASINQVIFVCPDGKVSWYWDSPTDPKTQYETYVSKELIDYIDSHYRTIPDKSGRAVTGFSMGGHGALWMAVTHPETFGAAGSMSGGVDIRPFPRNWNMLNSLGTYTENKAVWDSHTIATQVEKLRKISPNLIIDCGQGDFFFKVNETLHKDLTDKKINHTYISSPGEHNSVYWNKTFDWQLAFFVEFFAGSRPD